MMGSIIEGQLKQGPGRAGSRWGIEPWKKGVCGTMEIRHSKV